MLTGTPSRTVPNPVTVGYLAVLLLGHLWLVGWCSPATRHAVERAISTNLHNLSRDPLGSLIGSALFFDSTLTNVLSLDFVSTLITLVLGVAVMLAWMERAWGAPRAYAVFAAGHVGATLITSQVIRYAVAQGWYPQSVRDTLDFGISYGTQAVLGAATVLLPRAARPWWVLFVLAWPLGGVEWQGPIPDFTTVGHLVAAAIGFALAAVAARRPRESGERSD